MTSPSEAPISDAPVTQGDLKLLRDQIDLLQVSGASKTPWYRQIPLLISLCALALSILTFFVSQQRLRQEEIRSKKTELRTTLLELVSFQEAFNTKVRPIKDPRERGEASSILNSKRNLQLENAQSIAGQIAQHVSSPEYTILAYEMAKQSDFQRAEQYFTAATKLKQADILKAAALRSLGEFYFQPTPSKDIQKGRRFFNEALQLLTNANDDYSLYSMGNINESLGLCELGNGNMIEGGGKIELAREFYRKIKPPNQMGIWALQDLDQKLGIPPPQ
jgi:tetratricopeptide (TPR) repeat protein